LVKLCNMKRDKIGFTAQFVKTINERKGMRALRLSENLSGSQNRL
jgi:hypothetical protein